MKPYNSDNSKKEEIRKMFNGIAPQYDRLNHLLSFGVDKHWRRYTVKAVAKHTPKRILDLATGTGDMAIALAQKCGGASVTGADLSENMLEIARKKISDHNLAERIDTVLTEAECLPLPDSSYDAVTISFGIRNFHDIPQSLREINRVLSPEGKLFILEFSTPSNKLFGAAYRFYFHRILPYVGGIISKDRRAYKYLPASVDEFPDSERFIKMITDSGFNSCSCKSFMGGATKLYTANK